MNWIKNAKKPLLMVVVAVILAFQSAVTDGISAVEWVFIATALAGAVNTYITPDLTRYPQAKAINNAVIVILGALAGFIIGGVSVDEWFQLVILGLGAAGVPILSGPQHPASGVVQSNGI